MPIVLLNHLHAGAHVLSQGVDAQAVQREHQGGVGMSQAIQGALRARPRVFEQSDFIEQSGEHTAKRGVRVLARP